MDDATKAKLESLAEYTKDEWIRLNHDKKGTISVEDLEAMFRKIKSCAKPRENAEEMMRNIDADKNNEIDVGEFARSMYNDLAEDEGIEAKSSEIKEEYIKYVIGRCTEMIPADQR
ncbi:uncharacterized protein LOC135501497 [Lineus longissimus]|uniref:uncharacterized protein LOC135501497 n=1 Tax=Lineus longissimus TaxID=88925 RepID=UPI002B4C33C0